MPTSPLSNLVATPPKPTQRLRSVPKGALNLAIADSLTQTSSAWADIYSTGRVLQAPLGFVERDNVAELRQTLVADENGRALSDARRLQRHLLRGNVAGVVQNSIPAMSMWEKASNIFVDGWRTGRDSARLGLLGLDLMEGRGDADAIKSEVERVSRRLALGGVTRDWSWWLAPAFEGSRQLAQQWQVLVESVEDATPLTLVPTVLADQITSTLLIEGGTTYLEAKDLGLDEERAEVAALTVGVLNQGLDFASLIAGGMFAAPAVSALVRKKTQDELKELVKDKGLTWVAQRAAGRLGAIAGIEAGTEAMQEFVQIDILNRLSEQLPDGPEPVGFDETYDRMAGAARAGFAGALALGSPVAGLRVYADVKAMREAERTVEAIDAIAESVKESDAAKVSPEVTGNIVGDNLSDLTESDEVWVPADKLQEAVDAGTITNLGLEEGFAEKAANGEDVSIPYNLYVQHIVTTGLHEKVQPHIRTQPDGQSLEEAKEYRDSGMEAELDRLNATPDVEIPERAQDVTDAEIERIAGLPAAAIRKEVLALDVTRLTYLQAADLLNNIRIPNSIAQADEARKSILKVADLYTGHLEDTAPVRQYVNTWRTPIETKQDIVRYRDKAGSLARVLEHHYSTAELNVLDAVSVPDERDSVEPVDSAPPTPPVTPIYTPPEQQALPIELPVRLGPRPPEVRGRLAPDAQPIAPIPPRPFGLPFDRLGGPEAPRRPAPEPFLTPDEGRVVVPPTAPEPYTPLPSARLPFEWPTYTYDQGTLPLELPVHVRPRSTDVRGRLAPDARPLTPVAPRPFGLPFDRLGGPDTPTAPGWTPRVAPPWQEQPSHFRPDPLTGRELWFGLESLDGPVTAMPPTQLEDLMKEVREAGERTGAARDWLFAPAPAQDDLYTLDGHRLD